MYSEEDLKKAFESGVKRGSYVKEIQLSIRPLNSLLNKVIPGYVESYSDWIIKFKDGRKS